jgi:hypothetical protein
MSFTILVSPPFFWYFFHMGVLCTSQSVYSQSRLCLYNIRKSSRAEGSITLAFWMCSLDVQQTVFCNDLRFRWAAKFGYNYTECRKHCSKQCSATLRCKNALRAFLRNQLRKRVERKNYIEKACSAACSAACSTAQHGVQRGVAQLR